jgi:hypothetical protein
MTDVRDDQPDASDARNDELAVAAAAFLAQVLELEDDPTVLTGDLSAIKRDQNASIYTIQLESSVGPAAFLVYTYLLDVTGGDGHTGKELFDAGLATLQQAARRNTPGPRAVAHAETDQHGFILATTPGTYRALAGETSTSTLEPTPADLPATRDTDRVRNEAAGALLKLLQDANTEARTWIAAIQSASFRGANGDDIDDLIEFTDAETELALFLLDDASIGDLLRALNMLVATAQQRTADALGFEGDPESSWPEADA